MGIEDEDLGEKSSASKVSNAKQALELAQEKLRILAEENATKAEIAAYEKEIAKLALEQRQALQDMALEVERRLAAEAEEAKILFDLGEVTQEILDAKRELLRNAKEANDEEQKAIILAEKKAAILERQQVVEGSLALAKAQDQAVVNFRRATGASGEFDNNIINLERSLYTAGVSTDEAGQAVQSLFLNVSDFTEMSEDQQEVLAETTAILNELGKRQNYKGSFRPSPKNWVCQQIK